MRHLNSTLNKFIDGSTEEKCKLQNINLNLLLKHKCIIKKIKKDTIYDIPENTVKWASKYAFTRKKYGVVEKSKIITKYYLSSKGKRIKSSI